MDEQDEELLKRLHARHSKAAKFYEISSVLKPGKDESLDPSDRIYRKACETCGFVIESER